MTDLPAIPPAELKRRVEAIRFPVDQLARAANLDPNSVGRAIARKNNPRFDTIEKISVALIAEEKRLLDYLATLPELRSAAA